MPSRILEVPLLEPDSFLTIDVGADLPDDPTEVCQLLADEQCAPKWWLAISSAYTQKGALDSAIEVMTTGLDKSPVLKTEADRAPFLSMLSWLYLEKMRRSITAKKKEMFDKSSEYGDAAIKAFQSSNTASGPASVSAVLVQGTLLSAVGNFNDALQPFQAILATQPRNVYAKLGRARILYFRKNFRGALKLYQEVLRQAPTLSGAGDPRIGLGLCFWQLNDRVKARLSWERVLKLSQTTKEDENNDDVPAAASAAVAHACLGLWYLDAALHGIREEFESNYVQSIQHFQRAYMGGQVPLPALKIASYLFSKHDMVKVGKLTDKVLESATLPELLGEALFWKARAAHYAGDLETALTLYTQASSADPENVASSIGKGIVEIAQDRAPEALLTFELVVQSHPRSTDALFYAGLFGALTGQGENSMLKAREMLESYLTQARRSQQAVRPEALVALSQLWEKNDPTKAYNYLKQAASLLTEMPIPFTINLGALAFQIGETEEAESLFVSAAEAASKDDSFEKYRKLIAFNLARVQEHLGKVDEAKAGYESLGTVDAKARLALMDAAPTEELRTRAKQILDKHASDLEVRALYSWCLRYLVLHGSKDLAKQAAEEEQNFHKETLMKHDKHDVYSLVAMGNIYLNNAQAHPKSEVSKRQRSYMRAGEFFEKALQLDRHNAYAAQGVAIALAETKRQEQALSIFPRVRETLRNDVNAYVNIANCLMDLGDYSKATEMYNQAYKNSSKSSDDSQLLVLLGRAWFARGSRAKDPEALAIAVEWATKAQAARPDSSPLKFNVAYAQLQLGDVLRRQPAKQRTLQQLQDALAGVRKAVVVLKSFMEKEDPSLPFSVSDLDERLDHAEATLLPQLEQASKDQQEYERKAEEKREGARRKLEEERRLQEETRQKLQREKEEREARLAEERLKLQAQAAQWEAERAAEREQSASSEKDEKKRKGKRSRRSDVDDLIDDSKLPDDSESSSDEENSTTKQDKPAKSSTGGEDDNETADPTEKVTRRRAVMDDDDDDYDEEGEDASKNEEAENSNGEDDDEMKDLF